MSRGARWVWLVLIVFGACSTINVSRDYDTTANFSALRTYKIDTGKIVRSKGETDRRDSLLDKRIRAALNSELQSKGLEPADEPDVLVYYTIGTVQVVSAQPAWGFGSWYGQWGGWGRRWYAPGYWAYPGWGYQTYWLNQYPETQLLIEIVDARTNDLLWRAETEASGDDRDAKRLGEVIGKALEEFPPSADKG